MCNMKSCGVVLLGLMVVTVSGCISYSGCKTVEDKIVVRYNASIIQDQDGVGSVIAKSARHVVVDAISFGLMEFWYSRVRSTYAERERYRYYPADFFDPSFAPMSCQSTPTRQANRSTPDTPPWLKPSPENDYSTTTRWAENRWEGNESAADSGITYYSNGVRATRVGNTTFYSNGVTAERVGNSTFYSNGVTAEQVGNSTFYSNGVRAERVGNTTFYSNGTTAEKVGNTTFVTH